MMVWFGSNPDLCRILLTIHVYGSFRSHVKTVVNKDFESSVYRHLFQYGLVADLFLRYTASSHFSVILLVC